MSVEADVQAVRINAATEDFTPHVSGPIAGVNIVTLGSVSDEPRSWTLPSGITVKSSDALPVLKAWLATADPRQTICYISMMSAVRVSSQETYEKLNALDPEHQYLFRDYQLALILKVLLSDSRVEMRTNGRSIDAADVKSLCRMVTHSECVADRFLLSWPFLQRVAFARYWDQDNFQFWHRGLFLIREMNALIEKQDRFDLNQAFSNLYGLTLKDFVFLSFGLFAVTTGQPGKTFGIDQLIHSPEFDIDPEKARAFYDLISVSYSEFREHATHPDVFVPGYDLYSINPLTRWTLVRFPEGDHILPIPRLLLDRATFGIYFDFLPRLKEKERAKFGNFWGAAFSGYVGQLMSRLPQMPDPRKAEEMIANGNGLICDWIVEDSDTILLIECKTHGFNAKAKITGQENLLRADIAKDQSGSSIAKAVLQLHETSERPELKDKGKRLVHLIVVLDHIYHANVRRWLHRIIREEAEELNGEPLRGDFDFQVTDIGGFEVLCRLSAHLNKGPGVILAEKMDTEVSFELELSSYCWSLAKEGMARHPMSDDVDIVAIAEEYRRLP